jgi:hypothetical protein
VVRAGQVRNGQELNVMSDESIERGRAILVTVKPLAGEYYRPTGKPLGGQRLDIAGIMAQAPPMPTRNTVAQLPH